MNSGVKTPCTLIVNSAKVKFETFIPLTTCLLFYPSCFIFSEGFNFICNCAINHLEFYEMEACQHGIPMYHNLYFRRGYHFLLLIIS
jgi:hypothetical protein